MAKKLAKKKSATTSRKKAKASASVSRKIPSVNKPFTKTELITCVVKTVELPKKKVVEVFDTLQAIMHAHVRAGHAFSLPGVFKVTVVKKPATKQRKGINPFTGEPTIFKAKPARKVVKIKPLKKLKAAV
jgi:nucleoid DNA-binding protein